ANVAPGSPLIHSPVGDVLLSSQFVKRPDTNIFGSGAFLYSYDLGTQNRDAIEVTGIGFMNHYFRTQRLDLGFAEVTAGPRFNLPTPDDRVSRLSVKPYGILTEVGLGEAQYSRAWAPGSKARRRCGTTSRSGRSSSSARRISRTPATGRSPAGSTATTSSSHCSCGSA